MKLLSLALFACAFIGSGARAQLSSPWTTFDDPETDVMTGAIIMGEPYNPPEGEEEPQQIQAAAAAVPDCDVDDHTLPEIKELARGLEYDPWRIYEFCRNRIRHEPYWGSKKGALLTLWEESGNSFDTSSLMVALLRASGCTNVEYRYGPGIFTAADLDNWLGLLKPDSDDGGAYPDLTDAAFRTRFNLAGSTVVTPELRFRTLRINHLLDLGFPKVAWTPAGSTDIYFVPHVWVRFTDQGGTTREVDPSFKSRARRLESIIRPTAANFGHVRGDFLAAVGPTSPPANSVSGIGGATIASLLAGNSGQLLDWFNANHPGTATGAFIDEGWPNPVGGDWESNQLEEDLHYIDLPWLATTTWTAIPDTWKVKVSFAFGTGTFNTVTGTFATSWWKRDLNTACLQGKKLSMYYTGTNSDQLNFKLDDKTLFGSLPYITIPTAAFDIAVTVEHPLGTYNDSGTFTKKSASFRQHREIKSYTRASGKTYVYSYGFDASALHLRKAQDRLDGFRAEGLADSNWKVRTETLNVMGLSYLLQLKLSGRMLASQGKVLPLTHHGFARLGQENAYFIDFGLWGIGDASYSGNRTTETAVWQVGGLFGSALEHGMIEQLQGSGVSAISTAKVFDLANQQGVTLHLADNSNWASVRTTLEAGGWPAAALDSIASRITGTANFNAGAKVLLPQRADIGLTATPASGDWRGYGYAFVSNTRTIMAISGGYNPGEYSGGFLSEDGTVASAPVSNDYRSQSGYFSMAAFLNGTGQDPVTVSRMYAADPVDMATGAFTLENTDLACGMAMPRGLLFHRSYDSNRFRDDSAGLGYGWTHNLDIRASRRSGSRAAFGDSGTPGQMAAMYVATAVALDLFSNRNTAGKPAREWAISALVAKWGIDQVIRNGVSVAIGSRSMEFIKVPNTASGVFVPPAGVSSVLTESSPDLFTLSARHGNTTRFNASGKVSEIEDQHGKKAFFTYLSNGRLDEVKDCYNRKLKLTWSGTKITKVTETAGTLTRDVDFSYVNSTTTTADDNTLTVVTDPENRTFTHVYTDQRITKLVDGRNRVITENFYDELGRVKQQRLHGDPDKTFNLFFSGDQSIEQNPSGERTIYLYDRLNRSTGVIDATGNRSAKVYDGQNQVVEQASPRNNGAGADYRPVRYTYDSNLNLREIELPPRSATDPHGPYTAGREYDSQLRLWKEYDFKGNYTEYTYTSKHQVQTIRDRKGVIVTTNSYDTDGKLETVKDAANKTTSYLNYDSYGHARRIEYPAVEVGGVMVTPFETFDYNARGDLLSHTDRNGHTTGYTYNEARQPRVTTLPAVDGVTDTLEIQYDQAGAAWRSKDARGYWTQTETSQTGKLLSTTFPETDAGVAVAENHYDAQDRLDWSADPLNRITVPGYDAAGRVKSITDPLQRTSRTYYDADGQVEETRDPREKSSFLRRDFHGEVYETENALAQTSSTVPDANGNQDTLTNKRGKLFDFGYDANDRPVSLKTPMLKETTRDWTIRGLPNFVEEPSNDRAEFLHDDMGRQTQVTYREGGAVVATVTSHLDRQGNLKQIDETIGSVTKSVEFPNHDARHRLRTFVDVRDKTIGYRYDANGNLAELIYPDGKGSVLYGWDEMNRLKTVTDWENRKTEYFYDLAGQLKRVERANGTERRLLWDAAGQLKAVTELAADGQPLWYAIHRHDDAGRRDREHLFPALHAHTPPSFSATYDDDNRLDTFGGVSTVHDDDGNLTTGPLGADPAASFDYDSRNRLLSAGGLTYGYDPAGNRVSITDSSGETKWTIDPAGSMSRALVREKPDGTKTWYVYGLGLLYEVNQDGSDPETTTTYHPDSRGSTVMLTAGDGQTVVDRIEYDAWGAETWRQASYDTPFRYHGAYGVQTDTNGLCHMRARYYSPQIRRFLNADPLGFGGGSNWYQFAAGNPLAFADPLGLEPARHASGSPMYDMNDGGAGFRMVGYTPIRGYVDAFGDWHESFCMSCHNWNNPAAVRNYNAAVGGDTGWWIMGREVALLATPFAESAIANRLAAAELAAIRSSIGSMALDVGEDLSSAAGRTIWRHIPDGHPGLSDARSGVVHPWGETIETPLDVRALGHDMGMTEGTGLTSWTVDQAWATERQGRLGGVILETVAPEGSVWFNQAGKGREAQVLVPGTVKTR